jgi:ribose transport system substrate-binding protein
MKQTRLLAAAAVAAALLAGAARAEDFHGFDASDFNGQALPATNLKAMAADAKKAAPPRDGDTLVIGFANLQRDVPFGILVENGIKANADAAGVQLSVADNRLDGPTALQNAQSFVRRHVDTIIEFQTDVNFGPRVMQEFDRAHDHVIAIDIPMPGALFFGVNNPRAGFMTGSYLAAAAKQKFGEDAVKTGYLVVGILPQSGAIPTMRTDGEMHGFTSSIAGFPADHLITIDTKNTLQESFTQMNNVLGRIPPGVPIMITAINDQSVVGMLRAVRTQGRADHAIAVGMGADELQALTGDDDLAGATASFPERYGNYLIPLSLAQLAGVKLPAAVFVHHEIVNKNNVCNFYPKYPCKTGTPLAYTFPQAAFVAYTKELRTRPDLKDYGDLIPSE